MTDGKCCCLAGIQHIRMHSYARYHAICCKAGYVWPCLRVACLWPYCRPETGCVILLGRPRESNRAALLKLLLVTCVEKLYNLFV